MLVSIGFYMCTFPHTLWLEPFLILLLATSSLIIVKDLLGPWKDIFSICWIYLTSSWHPIVRQQVSEIQISHLFQKKLLSRLIWIFTWIISALWKTLLYSGLTLTLLSRSVLSYITLDVQIVLLMNICRQRI